MLRRAKRQYRFGRPACRQMSPPSLRSRAGSSHRTAAPMSAPRKTHGRSSVAASTSSALAMASSAGAETSHASLAPRKWSGDGARRPNAPPFGKACKLTNK